MAEAILKSKLVEKGEDLSDYKIYSLGIMALNGDSASEGSINAMKDIGIDISIHRSQRVNPENVNADIMIAMSSSHKKFLIENTNNRVVYMLNELAELGEKDINDPYGGTEDVYQSVRNEIMLSIEKVVDKIIAINSKK
jgi:protein-tyrosine phosphatase